MMCCSSTCARSKAWQEANRKARMYANATVANLGRTTERRSVYSSIIEGLDLRARVPILKNVTVTLHGVHTQPRSEGSSINDWCGRCERV